MTRLFSWRKLILSLLAVMVFTGLSSCGGGDVGPPQDIIAQAVATQADDDQTVLWQTLSPQTEAVPSLSVSQVKVRQVQPVQVASELAYEVTGTYQAKLRYNRGKALKQTQMPFTVVLQPVPDTEAWQRLQIEREAGENLHWHWEVLNGA